MLGLLAFALLSLSMGEFYPISNFPMYTRNGETTRYYYLQAANGDPVPVRDYFQISTSEIKKIYERKLKAWAKEAGKNRDDISSAERLRLCEETLDHVRSMRRPNSHPEWNHTVDQFEPMRLIRVDLRREESGITRSPVLLNESLLTKTEG